MLASEGNALSTEDPGTTEPVTQDATEAIYVGVGVAPGVAIGPVYSFTKDAYSVELQEISDRDTENEIARFSRAIDRAERELNKIASITREKVGEESATIFEAHLMILRDPSLFEAVSMCIRKDNCNADYAVQKVFTNHRQTLESRSNDFMRERVQDLVDVEGRLIRHLHRGKILSRIDPESVVVAEHLTAADIILFSRRDILGCAIDHGGATSHVSIMARALGVPTVVGTRSLFKSARHGDTVILDGFAGRVILRPSERTLDVYRERRRRYRRVLQEQKEIIPLASETLDGHKVALRANLELKQEIPLLAEYGAEGVGLFRTELLYLTYGRFLSEDEQYGIYRAVVEAARPHVSTFRLLDLGGDKILPLSHREHNPFLGWRGVRILNDKPDLLIPQLRAILRAAVHGPVRILIPMVTTMAELDRTRAYLEDVIKTLKEEGAAFSPDVPLGIMVEVPAVALMAEQFASKVDFFSIGTNDLTQYILAVDRGNDRVHELYQELHPAVLRMISNTVVAARRHDISVGVCGEMAADPRCVPILLGLGVNEMSAAPPYLPEIKRIVREITFAEARTLARNALAQNEASGVFNLLKEWFAVHNIGITQFMDLDPLADDQGKE